MTSQKPWDEMTPRERDALVAEKIFGLSPERLLDEQFYLMLEGEFHRLPKYSSDIADAWEVLKQDTFCCWSMKRDHESGVTVQIECAGNRYFAQAPSAPEAISLAALKAKGVEV